MFIAQLVPWLSCRIVFEGSGFFSLQRLVSSTRTAPGRRGVGGYHPTFDIINSTQSILIRSDLILPYCIIAKSRTDASLLNAFSFGTLRPLTSSPANVTITDRNRITVFHSKVSPLFYLGCRSSYLFPKY